MLFFCCDLLLLELQHPVHDLLVAGSHEVCVVLASVPGVAGVQPDAPQSLAGYLGADLVHVVHDDVVEILVVSPRHQDVLYPAASLVHPLLRAVPKGRNFNKIVHSNSPCCPTSRPWCPRSP